MTETLEKPAIGHVPSVEELQHLVDGPKTCNIFKRFKAGFVVRTLVALLGLGPKCEEPAVAHYEASCAKCGLNLDLWLCAKHERNLLEGAASGAREDSEVCALEVRKL